MLQLPLRPKLKLAEPSPKTMAAIVAENLDMVFTSGSNQSIKVLNSIDLSIPYGTIQLLMGPSGSGKTTLLSILAGLLTPTKGNVAILNEDITQLNPKQLTKFRLNNIGFVFQGFNLFPALTASENIEMILNLKGITGPFAQREIDRLLEAVGLGDRKQSLPRQLSGGQKQRVAIARALAGNPPIIMADEPTASLDSHSGKAVSELLQTLAKQEGATVVIVTHDPRIIDIADEILYLEDGKIQKNIDDSHLLHLPKH